MESSENKVTAKQEQVQAEKEHHHRHRHRRHKRSLKSRLLKFFHRNKKPVVVCGAVVLIVLVIIAVFFDHSRTESPGQAPSAASSAAPKKDQVYATDEAYTYIGLPSRSEKHSLVRPVVEQYMTADSSVSLSEILKLNDSSDVRLDVGLPVTLQFDLKPLSSDSAFRSAGVEVAETGTFQNALYSTLDTEGKASFRHLKTGMTYFYRLTLFFQDGRTTVITDTFETADTPRILTIDGIYNVRDIGGWKTADGRQIRQGLLYRGTEIDGAVSSSYKLTTAGIAEMTQTLGIKSDLDLRSPADAVPGAYIIGDIPHTYYPVGMYEEILKPKYAEPLRDLFSDLAKAERYPAYLHCTYGLDRTGTVCYLLEALLGVKEEDLMRDYELSFLYHKGANNTNILAFIDAFRTLNGSTSQEKAENHLLSIGVTAEEIESIRSILLE